jgi:large-conductance mechanosensitive channel
MMAKIPKVTVSFDADLNKLKSGVKDATQDVESFGDKVSNFGKKAAAAFAVAGAAIGAFAAASVKAAAEDEAGQKKLEETIRNTTNATADQIAGIDKYITAQSIATATTDDIIRPALSRLLRSTGDLTKAQELLTLSQEIAAATGKPLEAVTNAVAKSFDGSNTALTKLGVGIDAATLKTLTFDETQQLLNKTFDGFIENQSETAAFKFQQLSIAIDETKEQVGAALLPAVKSLTDYILLNVVPVVQSFVDGLTGQDGLNEGLTKSQKTAVEWGKKVRTVIDTVIEYKDVLIVTAGVIGGIFLVSKIAAGIAATIAAIKTLIVAYNLLKSSAIVAGVAQAFALNPLLGAGAVALAAGVLAGANALARSSDSDVPTPSTGSIPFASGFQPPAGTTIVPPATTGPVVVVPSGGGVATVVASAATVTKKAEQVVTDIAGAFDDFTSGTTTLAGVNAASNRGFPYGTSGVNTNTLAGIMAASGQPAVVINVNSPSIIDEEGFTRALNNAQNNSYFRGTGGATNLVGI